MVMENPTLFPGVSEGEAPGGESATNPLSLMAWNTTYVANLTDPSAEYTFVLSGWNIRVKATSIVLTTGQISMQTYASWWVFEWDKDVFKWYKDGVLKSQINILISYDEFLSMDTLDADYVENTTISYTAKNSHTSMIVAFTFNFTDYATPSEAYADGALSMVFDVEFSERNTSLNILGFISQLFTFSLPGTPWAVNTLLWLMIFPATFYLCFIVVLKVIGAIFGGG